VHELGFQAKYLISPHTHEKMMAYESCTRKKLVALFEFIDKDKDGIISTFDLQSGMTRLLSPSSSSSSSSTSSFSLASSRQEEQICEFEIEELLRCVPQADSTGGITLKQFLDAEANVLPGLTRLRLLQ
jgi:Ca2+-binding EF-hand superfamily protein